MKRIAMHTIVALLVVAAVVPTMAGKYDGSTLVGTWEFDMVKMYEAALEAAGQELPPGMDINAMVQGSYMRITFNKDGTYAFETKTMGGENSEEGKYEVVEKGDDSVTIKSVDAKGEAETIKIVFIDKDHFDAMMSNGDQEMVMSATRTKNDKKEKKAKAE